VREAIFICAKGRAHSFPDGSRIGRHYVLLKSNTNRVNRLLPKSMTLLAPKIESVFENNDSRFIAMWYRISPEPSCKVFSNVDDPEGENPSRNVDHI